MAGPVLDPPLFLRGSSQGGVGGTGGVIVNPVAVAEGVPGRRRARSLDKETSEGTARAVVEIIHTSHEDITRA